MGKEWYRSARSSKRGSGCDGDAENPSGCMCAFFQFFDLHPLHFPIQQQQPPPSFKPPSSTTEDHKSIPKGAEAPRNSLESEDGTMSSISKEDLRIPKSIQIKTSRRERGENGNNDLSSEISSSPSTKTPTLVARLMGLDLLPDAQSPSSSSSSSSLSCLSTPNPRGNSRFYQLKPRQQHILTKPRNSTDSDIVVSRSLPETPRISSARRSDVEHRLSLQINKENIGLGEDLELPRFSFSKRKFEENSCRSPSHYARQIVKQVKESVSRKVGLDITNTVKNREQAREEHVGQFRVKKSPKTSLKGIDESSPGKHSNSNSSSSSSPRLRFMEAKQHKPSTATTTPSPLTPKDQNSLSVNLPSSPPISIQPQIIARVLAKPKPQALPEQVLQNQRSASKCKKDANEKYSPRLKKPLQTSSAVIRNKQEESFVRPPSPTRANEFKSRSKRTNNLLNISTVLPNVLPVKTDPSPPATKIPPQKQIQVSDAQESKRSSQLSSCSRQTCSKQEAKCTLATRESNSEEDDKIHGASTTGPNGPPVSTEYVINMLARTTESTTETIVSLNNNHKWLYSIFHHLNRETYLNNQPDLRRNRRLLFDLIGEILGEILKPWVVQHNLGFESIVETVWKKIGSFRGAKCEVLEDIDGVIEKDDLGKTMMKKEGLDWKEGLVEEIEGYILETMMQEAVIACGVV